MTCDTWYQAGYELWSPEWRATLHSNAILHPSWHFIGSSCLKRYLLCVDAAPGARPKCHFFEELGMRTDWTALHLAASSTQVNSASESPSRLADSIITLIAPSTLHSVPSNAINVAKAFSPHPAPTCNLSAHAVNLWHVWDTQWSQDSHFLSFERHRKK